MLLGDYGSDSESDNEAGPSVVTARAPAKPAPPQATAAPAAKAKKRGGPVRITLDLPKSNSKSADDEDGTAGVAGDTGDEEGGPDAKRAKTGADGIKGGKGSSMLLGMLPPPKRKLPVAAGAKSSLAVNKAMAAGPAATSSTSKQSNSNGDGGGDDDGRNGAAGSGMLLPPSLGRSKSKAAGKSSKDEEDGLDLFGLGSASASAPAPVPSSIVKSVKPPTVTSAPSVADYVPPPPTASDPYPGYYQLPSGAWAAYDPAYYASFFASTSATATDDDLVARPKGARGEDGRLGHHWDAFEGKEGDVIDVHAATGLAEARAEEQRKQAMAKPKLSAAGDEFEYKAVGQIKGLASERHQLSSLLNTAYTQREALEERIAQNKRNARSGKSKYGF